MGTTTALGLKSKLWASADALRNNMDAASGSMRVPSLGDKLQASELADLLAYLRSCRDKNE